jgi:hypothetical protein
MPGILGLLGYVRGVPNLVVPLLVIPLIIAAAVAAEPKVNTTVDNVAINGYDTVAYFTEGKATKGSAELEAVWQDARWRFSNEEHRRLFEADPSRYAPQFGGWCASGVAAGEYYEVDAEAWAIVDNKLYLNYSRKARDKWLEDHPEKIAKAERIWAERAKNN